MSSPSEGSDSTLAHEMQAHRASLLSEAEKLSAFRCVRRGRNDLSGAMAHMERAVEHAQTAKQIDPNKFALQPHYLSYWLNIFSARKCIEDRDFQEALQYLDKAITEANRFSERSIFPNYFANMSDLVQERLLVETYIAFSKKHFVDGHTFLEAWLKAMKEDLQGSWKYANVAVRNVLIDALSKELSPPPASKIKKSIEEASGSVRLGKAGCQIADFALLLASQAERGLLTNDSYEKIVNQCNPLFPLSSQTGYRVSLGFFEQIPYDELPEYFGEWIREAERLEGEALFHELELGLRAYLIIICDYYNLKREALVQKDVKVEPLPKDFQRGFVNMDVSGLANAVISLLKSIGKRPKGRPRLVVEFQQWLNHYLQLRDQFRKDHDPKVAEQMLRLTKEKLIGQTYIEMFPLVIQVTHVSHDEGEAEYRANVLWQRPDAEQMILRGKMPFEIGKYYYLKPHWKNFYHGVQDTNHHTFEAYQSPLFEECVIDEYRRLLERRHTYTLRLTAFEFPVKIREFEEIIDDPPKKTKPKNEQWEKKIKRFLKENDWMLGMQYVYTEREWQLQENYATDFLCKTYNEEYDFWEVKLPTSELFKQDGQMLRPREELNAGLDQVKSYQDAVPHNIDRIYNDKNMKLGQPWGFLLIGRYKNAKEREGLRQFNIDWARSRRTVLTYDDLILRAKGLVEKLHRHEPSLSASSP